MKRALVIAAFLALSAPVVAHAGSDEVELTDDQLDAEEAGRPLDSKPDPAKAKRAPRKPAVDTEYVYRSWLVALPLVLVLVLVWNVGWTRPADKRPLPTKRPETP